MITTPRTEVIDTQNKLSNFTYSDYDVAAINQALALDQVALIRHVPEQQIDETIFAIAAEYDLTSGLELQAGFSGMYGHRQMLSKYYMTVNHRADYQCTQPHSEGSSFQNIQLVSFYCYENTTDGGVTTLFNVDQDQQSVWENLRERVTRAKLSDSLRLDQALIGEARMRYQIKLPDDLFTADDIVIKEGASATPGLGLVDVLAQCKKTESIISKQSHYGYWSSISRFDSAGLADFKRILQANDLYKTPGNGADHFDDGLVDKQLWSSGTRLADIFQGRLFIKLQPGDLVVLNNLTWCHGVSNWTPGSGKRKVGVALA